MITFEIILQSKWTDQFKEDTKCSIEFSFYFKSLGRAGSFTQ